MKKQLVQRQKQLRGEALAARISEVVRQYVLDIDGDSNSHTVSPSALAKLVPCSKTTILKYRDVIENGLIDAGQRLSRRSGAAKNEALSDKVHLLQNEVMSLKTELAALHLHHVSLYERLLMGSADLEVLVRDDAITRSQEAGRCILCGGTSPQRSEDKIVALNARKVSYMD